MAAKLVPWLGSDGGRRRPQLLTAGTGFAKMGKTSKSRRTDDVAALVDVSRISGSAHHHPAAKRAARARSTECVMVALSRSQHRQLKQRNRAAEDENQS